MIPFIVLGIVVILLLCLLIEALRCHISIDVEEFPVFLSELPEEFDGFRMALLADIHNDCSPQKLIKRTEEANPDIVLFGGDMLERKKKPYHKVLPIIQTLAEKYPSYAILGNHEEIYRMRFREEWKAFRKETASLHWLENQWTTLKRGNAEIYLSGISVQPRYYYRPKGRNEFSYLPPDGYDRIVREAPMGVRLLMAHDPFQLSIYENWGMDLVLAGHVHGGIVRLPFFGGILSPARTFRPPKDNGYYRQGLTGMVVSRGLGNNFAIPRLWNRRHLPIIILKKSGEY